MKLNRVSICLIVVYLTHYRDISPLVLLLFFFLFLLLRVTLSVVLMKIAALDYH